MEVVSGKTYQVTFNAKTDSFITNDPQILVRIVKDYSPYSLLAQRKYINLTASSTTYLFDLAANAIENDAVMTV